MKDVLSFRAVTSARQSPATDLVGIGILPSISLTSFLVLLDILGISFDLSQTKTGLFLFK
jgi:hypothetical protein